MKTYSNLGVDDDYPVTVIIIHGKVIDRFRGLPQPIGVHQAINYRATVGACLAPRLPTVRLGKAICFGKNLIAHLPYFRHCTVLNP
jgi:hypothetical protein